MSGIYSYNWLAACPSRTRGIEVADYISVVATATKAETVGAVSCARRATTTASTSYNLRYCFQ